MIRGLPPAFSRRRFSTQAKADPGPVHILDPPQIDDNTSRGVVPVPRSSIWRSPIQIAGGDHHRLPCFHARIHTEEMFVWHA